MAKCHSMRKDICPVIASLSMACAATQDVRTCHCERAQFASEAPPRVLAVAISNWSAGDSLTWLAMTSFLVGGRRPTKQSPIAQAEIATASPPPRGLHRDDSWRAWRCFGPRGPRSDKTYHCEPYGNSAKMLTTSSSNPRSPGYGRLQRRYQYLLFQRSGSFRCR